MIRAAQDRSAGFPNITFQAADVLDWRWPTARFDCIASIAMLHHLPLDALLESMRAALAPGGMLLALDLYAPAGWREWPRDALALAASVALRIRHNHRVRDSQAARQAWGAHAAHDHYLSRVDVRRICAAILPVARVTQHLLWRYSIVWQKTK
jgi:SAM-dependent methyltransferase